MRRMRKSAGHAGARRAAHRRADRRPLSRDDAGGGPRRDRAAKPTFASWSRAASASSPTIRPPRPSPSIVVIVKPNVDPPLRGVRTRASRCRSSRIVRNHPGSVNPLIKSNNLLNNALAMQEAFRRGGFEGVMRQLQGRAGRVHAVQPVHRQERRGADAADRRRAAAGHHARVPVRGRTRMRGFRCVKRCCARRGPVRRRRGVPHQHDARSACRSSRLTIARLASARRGPITRALLTGIARGARSRSQVQVRSQVKA